MTQLAALGLFVFERLTFPFEGVDRDTDWRQLRSPRVGARDAIQFLGPGEERLSIFGAIVPEAGGSYGSINTLRDMADEGLAWEYVDGRGRVWGSYVIERMREGYRHLIDDGTPRKVDFSLDLVRIA